MYAISGILANVTLGIMEFAYYMEINIAKVEVINAASMDGIAPAGCIVMYVIINTDAQVGDVFLAIRKHGQNASQTVIVSADGIVILALRIVQDLIQAADVNLVRIVPLKIIAKAKLIMSTNVWDMAAHIQ